MAKASRFAALAEFRQTQEHEGEAPAAPELAPIAPEPDPVPPTSPDVARGRGRPPGKRSDPAWKLYSHFLRRKTQREAAALLLDRDDGRDLSDVLQGLLEQWLVDEKRKGT